MEPHVLSHSLGSTIAPAISITGNTRSGTSELDKQQRNPPSSSGDTVTLSQEGKDKAAQVSGNGQAATNLDEQDLRQLQQLKRRDIEVRTHEQAHLSAAGAHAKGGPSFTYQKGPDGNSYAVGGEVGIDVSKESTPEATISKMQTIKRAALAPANPSSADRRIAAQATAKEMQAQQELMAQQQEELLQSDKAANPLTSPISQNTPSSSPPVSTSSSYSTLKMKIDAYEQMAHT